MGLSNEERYVKIIHSINHITDLSENLKDTQKLKKLCERLWYEFLKQDSDGLFWFSGSDLSSDHMKSGLLGVAFCCHAPSRGSTIEELNAERRKEDKYYDHYKTLSGFFDMDRLLVAEKRAVLLIYAHTQNIAYALCRYRDEFMKQYEDLNFIMRTIQGECFKLMKEDREYTYAWMLHHLCDMIYTMDEKDIVNQWWTKDCNSHHIHLDYDKYEEVSKAFKKYQFRKMTAQDRIDVTLMLIGKHYGKYKHLHDHFMGQVVAYNKKHKVKINVAAIEEAFAKGQEAEKVEQKKPYERSCEFTSNYVDHKGKVQNLWD